MARLSNGSLRCDWCGVLTRDPDGAYRKPDGTTGYIHQPEWERFAPVPAPSGRDACKDCERKHRRCPACGSRDTLDAVESKCHGCGYAW